MSSLSVCTNFQKVCERKLDRSILSWRLILHKLIRTHQTFVFQKSLKTLPGIARQVRSATCTFRDFYECERKEGLALYHGQGLRQIYVISITSFKVRPELTQEYEERFSFVVDCRVYLQRLCLIMTSWSIAMDELLEVQTRLPEKFLTLFMINNLALCANLY